MNKLSLFKEATIALAFSFFTLINIVFWQSAIGGWIILGIFCLYFAYGAHRFLRQYFNISDSFRIRVLTIFLVLFVWGSIGGCVALVYKMSALSLALATFLTGLFFGYLKLRASGDLDEKSEIEDETKQVVEQLPSSKVGVLLYLVLIVTGFYFLYQSKSNLYLATPWQTISPQFIGIFFGATLILGLLIFYRIKAGTILFLLILQAFLLHAYLPLSHELFYGADGWRHLATQSSWWQNGAIISPALSSEPLGFWQRLDLGALAYAQFNTLSLLFQKLCQVDPIIFVRYFLPIIWSIILPIILFEIGRVFGLEKKASLFLVWLSAWPFALQVSGSFSLPVNLGILFWLIAIWLMMKNSEKTSDSGIIFLIILGILFTFTHTVFFVLFWLSFILINLLKINFSKISLALIAIFTAAIMPMLELISHFSSINYKLDWWAQIKSLVSNFTGWYLAFGLRSSDISTGNVFFNQPPLSTLVMNWFITWRGWVVLLMLVFWLVWIFGIKKMLQTNSKLNNFWVVLSVGVFGSYVVSRYFLSGENIFARRLDATLAVLFILPAVYFGYDYLKNKVVIFLTIFIFSAAITTSYTLGPDAQVVSVAEYKAMQYIWNREAGNKKVCVLADIYPLLALEQISARQVIGGGFPINSSFAQPERIKLFDLAKTNPESAVLQAKKLLDSNNCYLVGDYSVAWPMERFGNIKVYNF